MTSIVEQQQDLFFEFDFEQPASVADGIIDVAKCKKDIFLIGCFRNDQKHQIDWIINNPTTGDKGRYNVRLGKGRNGWINKENPRIANPKYVILYEFGNEDIVYGFKAGGSKVYSEKNMTDAGYDTPDGDYLVYRLTDECQIVGVDVKKVLAQYRERTNWVDGKPIYLTGQEILSAERPKVKREKQTDANIFNEDVPSLQDVINGINHNFRYSENALTSIDLFSGCGGLTKGFQWLEYVRYSLLTLMKIAKKHSRQIFLEFRFSARILHK